MEFVGDDAALILETGGKRLLLISDIHLGYEAELAREGIYFPNQLPNILERISKLLERHSVDTLVLLGDVKHRVAGVSWRESRQVTELLKVLSKRVGEIIITPGNHDAGVLSLAEGMAEVVSGRGLIVGDAWMLHGHCWPPPQAAEAKLMVIGHTHPTVSFARGPGSRRKIFLAMKTSRGRVAKMLSAKAGVGAGEAKVSRGGFVRLLIMPHFNNALQGVELSQLVSGGRGVSPLLRSGLFKLEGASILMLDGTRLGEVEWYVRSGQLW
ncbi:MAG: metallophosphoesterase [Nitrososphaerota archaeon]|nr:metallophosphoesterase [Candidatus Calditenuaceae archaeon]MDW8073334.1 metallophosphoesterase [Nitrososphaerota archaeon]